MRRRNLWVVGVSALLVGSCECTRNEGAADSLPRGRYPGRLIRGQIVGFIPPLKLVGGSAGGGRLQIRARKSVSPAGMDIRGLSDSAAASYLEQQLRDVEEGKSRRFPAETAVSHVVVPMLNNGRPKETVVLPIYFPASDQPDIPLRFAIDTLSKDTLVSPAARDRLDIPRLRSTDGPDSEASVKHIFHNTKGEKVSMPAALLGDPDGDYFFSLHDAVVADLEPMGYGPRIDGVLALDFLSQYDLVLDFENDDVSIYLAGAATSGAIKGLEDLEEVMCNTLPGGKLGIKIELNGGGAFTGVLDAGSSSSVGNWAAGRDLDITSLGPSRTTAETGRKRPLFRAGLDTLQIGNALLTTVPGASSEEEGRLTMHVGYLPEFDRLCEDISGSNNLARQLALVGLDQLGHKKLVLSVQSKRIYFATRAANDVWADFNF